MHGILSDQAIRRAIDGGDIEFDPFDADLINPGSVDLTLGPEVRLYNTWVMMPAPTDGRSQDGEWFLPLHYELDVQKEPTTTSFTIDPERGWLLKPGILYLMHTTERVRTNRYIPVVDGKSSIGRLGVQVHATAGYGEVGFDGQYTLEVIAQHPLRVYPGMRFCQIRFHTVVGEVERPYDQVGHYTGESARGAVASQAWRQFKKPPV